MAKKKLIYRRPFADALSVTGIQDNARGLVSSVFEGLVVDVILDHKHPEYSRVDGFNVGSIKVRIFGENDYSSSDALPWVDPMDTTIQEYPLIGEIVVIHRVLGGPMMYTKKIPIARRIQENAMLNLNAVLDSRTSNTLSNTTRTQTEVDPDIHKFGKYYRPDSRVRQLKHFEGDTIFQGRMGQSIRFGSSQLDPSSDGLAPNIILRAGQAKDIEKTKVSIDTVFGLILEDINDDPASIWMVSDQTLPYVPITSKAGSFMRSVKNPPQQFDKSQIIINSGRVAIQARDKSIFLFSGDGIHLNSFGDATIDTDKNILFTANEELTIRVGKTTNIWSEENLVVTSGKNSTITSAESTAILGSKIFIGSLDEEEEPMVGGTSLAQAIDDLIDIFQSAPFLVTTPVGPGKLTPDIIEKLTEFREKVLGGDDKNEATFNSKNNFVSLENAEVKVESNEFTVGEKPTITPNEWKLSAQYYRVV